MAQIKVLLIQDNRLLRDGAIAMLSQQKDIRAVSAPCNKGSLTKAKKFAPNVVLFDSNLNHNGPKILDSIKKQCPQTELVMMDLLVSHSDVVTFINHGLSGIVPRDARPEDLLHVIRSVAKGVKSLPATRDNSLFSQIVEEAIQEGRQDRVFAAVKFSKREQEVICLMNEGKSISETSIKLKISIRTVKSHVRNILEKLALYTRLEQSDVAHSSSPSKNASSARKKTQT